MSEKALEKSANGVTTEVNTDSSEETADTSEIFPEGGYQAWLTLLGATLVQFSTFGYTNSFGVYEGNYTPSDVGWIGGTQVFLTFAAGLFTGRAFDRGYFHHLMIVGALLHVFSYFMLSLSHENQYYQVFLSHALGGGLASGIAYIPSLAVVSHYFKRRRPFTMGIVASGTALGAVLHPIMLNKLFQGSIGFHNGVRISTALNAGVLIIANMVMRTRLPPQKTGSAIPIAEFARDPPYLIAVMAGIFITFGLFFPVFFLQLDAVTLGVDPRFAFYCLSILNAASIFGRILPAFFAPRVGVFNTITFFTFGMAVLLYCLGAVKDASGVVAFAVIFGFVSGGGITVMPSMLASLAKDMSEIGARIGIFFGSAGIIGLVATPIAGALLTSQFHWWRPIIFTGTMMLMGACLLATSRFLVVRRKRTQIV